MGNVPTDAQNLKNHMDIKKIILLSLLITFIFTGASFKTEGECYMSHENILLLEVEVNKTAYHVGEAINIRYKLVNNSSNDIVLTKPNSAYETNAISIYNLEDKKMEVIRKFDLTLKIPEKKDSFIILKPNEKTVITYQGKIRKNKIFLVDSFEERKGYFIDFMTSAINIENVPGEYKIICNYKSSDYLNEFGQKQLGFSNIWSGEIVSKGVLIKILD